MKKVLFGYGGHAREVAAQIGEKLTHYVDDRYADKNTKPISKFNPKNELMLVAVGDSKERKKIVNRLPKNTNYFTFIHPTALIMDDNIIIGKGSFIGAYSIITSNVKIGSHSLLNRSNHIGHDTTCNNFLSMMPNSVISGNVSTGECFYLGTNSSVKEKIKVCDNVTIGLNSGVVKDIHQKGVYGGAPCVKIK